MFRKDFLKLLGAGSFFAAGTVLFGSLATSASSVHTVLAQTLSDPRVEHQYRVFKRQETYFAVDRKGLELMSSRTASAVLQYVVNLNDGPILLEPHAAGVLDTWTFDDSVNVLDYTEIDCSAPFVVLSRSTLGASPRCIFKVIGTPDSRKTKWSIKNAKMTGPGLDKVNGMGIQCKYAKDGVIEDCDISGFGNSPDDGGITIRHGINIRINKCRIYGNKNGIITGEPGKPLFPEAENCDFTENECFSNSDDGIHLQHGRNNMVINNRCYSNGESGIDLLGEEHDFVNSNICNSNTYEGIEIGNQTRPFAGRPDRLHTLIGNACFSNQANGIKIIRKSERCTIEGNNCYENTGSGIVLTGEDTDGATCSHHIIKGNNLKVNKRYGLRLVNGAVGYNTITENRVESNSNYGIVIQSRSAFSPKHNKVYSNFIAGNKNGQIHNSVDPSWGNDVFNNLPKKSS